MADTERRSKRRSKSRYGTTTVPSAVHYVGYVEDDETPEMIMSKFQELENIQRQVSAAAGEEQEEQQEVGEVREQQEAGMLTEEQLLEVFKQTSMFNVKTALQNNAMLAGIDEMLEYANDWQGEDDMVSDDEDMLRSFWSDDDDEWETSGKKKKSTKVARKSSGGRQRAVAAPRTQHRIVTAYNPSTQALVRRKVKIADPNEIQYIRIPPSPIPLSWGRTVAPLTPQKQEGHKESAVVIEVDSVTKLNPSMLPHAVCEGVLVNSKWYRGLNHDAAIQRLESLPLKRIVPYGIVCVWTPKELVQQVCKTMLQKGYAYIENMTWVYMVPNNTIYTGDSQYARLSHLTLYMFRAIDRSVNIELRHQRSPDVVFDYLKAGDKCPVETYTTLEILLPQSKGKLMEVWGTSKENDRAGWLVVESE